MNAAGRKRLEDLNSKLADIQVELEEIASEEQDKYDNMPEGLQGSEKGEKLDSIISALNDAASNAEDLGSAISDIVNDNL